MMVVSTIKRTLGISKASIETPYICWMCSVRFVSAAEFLCHLHVEKGQ